MQPIPNAETQIENDQGQVDKNYIYQTMVGNKRHGGEQALFSHKIHPPEVIKTIL
jgi:hypothetical protein